MTARPVLAVIAVAVILAGVVLLALHNAATWSP